MGPTEHQIAAVNNKVRRNLLQVSKNCLERSPVPMNIGNDRNSHENFVSIPETVWRHTNSAPSISSKNSLRVNPVKLTEHIRRSKVHAQKLRHLFKVQANPGSGVRGFSLWRVKCCPPGRISRSHYLEHELPLTALKLLTADVELANLGRKKRWRLK
jgi:hypothetical protein